VQLQTAAGRTFGSRTIDAASRAQPWMLVWVVDIPSYRAAGKAYTPIGALSDLTCLSVLPCPLSCCSWPVQCRRPRPAASSA
jgi:hypothetical protein